MPKDCNYKVRFFWPVDRAPERRVLFRKAMSQEFPVVYQIQSYGTYVVPDISDHPIKIRDPMIMVGLSDTPIDLNVVKAWAKNMPQDTGLPFNPVEVDGLIYVW